MDPRIVAGGCPGGRPLEGDFERLLERLLGDRVKASRGHAVDLWCALANIVWLSPEGDQVAYSFRAAGDVVAALREEGDYLEWYCSGREGRVAGWIEARMAAEGWRHTTWDALPKKSGGPAAP